MGLHEYDPWNPLAYGAASNKVLATGLRLDTTFGFEELLGFLSCGINRTLRVLRQTPW
jgi:hypothetical protein